MDATIDTMATKTLKQLQALAKKAGLKGYSKLTKSDLEKKLARRDGTAANTAAAPARTKKPSTAPATKRKSPAPATSTQARTPTPVDPNHTWWEPTSSAPNTNGDVEERIESAKYVSRQREAATTPAVLTDLGEDIEQLPPLHYSTLVLLPQKPGVLHAYWALGADAPRGQALQLRLCRAIDGKLDVQHEAAVAVARGHYYFHVPEAFANHEAIVQLGYYRGSEFVSAVDRGVARIPTLYASARTDRWWWISEADFRRMYVRSGGELRGRGLRWAGSIGSPGAALPPNETSLAWPGGVSSSG